MNWKSPWFESKKGENTFKFGYINPENQKPFITMLKTPNLTIKNFFSKAPKKW